SRPPRRSSPRPTAAPGAAAEGPHVRSYGFGEHERDVVLRRGAAEPPGQLRQNPADEIVEIAVTPAREDLDQPLLTELASQRVEGLRNAVRVEGEQVSARQHPCLLIVEGVAEHAQRDPSRCQTDRS